MLLSAREACSRLNVKPATLYAYVSRGLVRSAETPGSRERRYEAADVDRLARRRRGRRPRAGALLAFDASMPVLDSGLTLIEDGRLYYRGQDAIRLSHHADLEGVARLLWGVADYADPFVTAVMPADLGSVLSRLPPAAQPIERALSVLAALVPADAAAARPGEAALIGIGARLVRGLVDALTGEVGDGAPAHRALARAWRLDRRETELVRRALVLLADHELNVSAYVARAVASTGASLHAVVIAGLSALSGPRHGGAAAAAEGLMQSFLASRDPKAALAERIRRAESLPGFGHALYPEGDPRAAALLEALIAVLPPPKAAHLAALVRDASRYAGRAPTIDFALGALSAALGLPRGAALGLFMVARSVGWIAHALEHYAEGPLIRPRARYVGPPPEPARSG
jgi:citrate synthase